LIGRPFRVATLFGIPIKVDWSWLVIVGLITASFAFMFSQEFPRLSWPFSFLMGAAVSVLLFASVLAHELSHALVALQHRIPIRGITLFIFGGAAEMGEEPPDAAAELWVALAGPVMSLALAVGFGGLYWFGSGWLPSPVTGVVKYLGLMNGMLVAFNVVPGFPLDGGRVLRAVLWGIWGDLRAATRVASALGSGFATLIMLLGILLFVSGNPVGGIWYVFIGLFLRMAAQASYHQMMMRDSLRGFKVRDLMNPDVVSVSPQTHLEQIVHGVVLTSGRTEFPVVEGGRLLGMVGVAEIRAVDRSLWRHVTASEVMRRGSSVQAVSSLDDADRVLTLATNEEVLIPVVDGDTLVGVTTPRELLKRLRLMAELRKA
jgi:Zn-dependent protease/CBS domain-containing protein